MGDDVAEAVNLEIEAIYVGGDGAPVRAFLQPSVTANFARGAL